jgi:hypothetical protein
LAALSPRLKPTFSLIDNFSVISIFLKSVFEFIEYSNLRNIIQKIKFIKSLKSVTFFNPHHTIHSSANVLTKVAGLTSGPEEAFNLVLSANLVSYWFC